MHSLFENMLQTLGCSTMSQFVPHERRFVTEKGSAVIR